MARFYAMDLQPSLFGEVMLIRRWGRIGTGGRTLTEWFETEPRAMQRQAEIASCKRRGLPGANQLITRADWRLS